MDQTEGDAASEEAAVGRGFKRATVFVVVAVLALDFVGALGVFVVYSRDGITNALLAVIGLLALNVALLMPLAQMWEGRVAGSRPCRRVVGVPPVITIVDRDGPVRVRVQGDGVDVAVG